MPVWRGWLIALTALSTPGRVFGKGTKRDDPRDTLKRRMRWSKGRLGGLFSVAAGVRPLVEGGVAIAESTEVSQVVLGAGVFGMIG